MGATQFKTVPQFNQGMLASARNWYAQRNIGKQQLATLHRQLVQSAQSLKAIGAPDNKIKDAIQAKQAHLLGFTQAFEASPIRDGTFETLSSNGIDSDLAQLSLAKRHKAIRKLLTSAFALFLKGTICSEGQYAGLGTRLESKKPKFNMAPQDLLDSLQIFAARTTDPAYKDVKLYKDLAKQIDAHGGLRATQGRFAHLHELSLGERIFIQKAFEIYSIARNQYGMNSVEIRKILLNLKLKIMLNKESGDQVIETFVKNNFFGLDPRNVVFMKVTQYSTVEVDEKGDLKLDPENVNQMNHGLTPFQSMLDGQWYRIIPNIRGGYIAETALPSTDYIEFQQGIKVNIVESVEDSTQLMQAYNMIYIALIKKYGNTEGIRMFMQMVAQKTDNPQKGGFLASVDDGSGSHKNAVIESNRAPHLAKNDIKYLNRNRNGFFNPAETDQAVLESPMFNDLHPTFKVLGWDGDQPIMRIVCDVPQGDRNLYVKTKFFQFSPKAAIENLKDPLDITPTLMNMAYLEAHPEIVAFARHFLQMSF